MNPMDGKPKMPVLRYPSDEFSARAHILIESLESFQVEIYSPDAHKVLVALALNKDLQSGLAKTRKLKVAAKLLIRGFQLSNLMDVYLTARARNFKVDVKEEVGSAVLTFGGPAKIST